MASGGDDWDTVTYLRKKPQSSSALKTDRVNAKAIAGEGSVLYYRNYHNHSKNCHEQNHDYCSFQLDILDNYRNLVTAHCVSCKSGTSAILRL